MAFACDAMILLHLCLGVEHSGSLSSLTSSTDMEHSLAPNIDVYRLTVKAKVNGLEHNWFIVLYSNSYI